MTLMNFLLVFLGGGAGCVTRYMIGLGFQRTAASLPWATFLANISACLIFALTIWLLRGNGQDGMKFRLFLLTGFCGGLSTFSSFGYETFLLLRQGLLAFAFLNILLSSALCVLIFYIFN
jgi:CrcB protein